MRPLFFIAPATFFCLLFAFCRSKKGISPASGPAAIQQPAPQEPGASVGLNLGNAAPEITLQNPEGVTVPLSSLRGKVVLIDFWASWCGPCRLENPTLVKAYKKYRTLKGKEFTIYSVSLDANAGAWKRAIEADSLVWNAHVSDLKGWDNAAAARYGVTGIPINFLINEKGIIINKNLRGEALLAALEKLTH